MKCPSNATEIRTLVHSIWKSHGAVLKPIPKILMRGVSGWIKEEVLIKADSVGRVEWLQGTHLLKVLRNCFSKFSEEAFSDFLESATARDCAS